MKTIAVVPMKLNNTRLPSKNTKSFTNGNPLCQYILNTLLSVEMIDDVYVYCSDDSIVDFLPKDVKYLKRPIFLDQDSTSMNEVLEMFASEITADIYLMSHTTAPFIKRESIEKGLNAVINENYDSSFAVRKIQDFFWLNGVPFNYSLDSIPRTQDLTPLYMETSGFYIYKQNVIKQYCRRIGEKPFLVEVDEIESIDIDEENDFIIADAMFNYLKSKGAIYE